VRAGNAVGSRAPPGAPWRQPRRAWTRRRCSRRGRVKRSCPRQWRQPKQARTRWRLGRRRSRPLQVARLSLPGQVPWSQWDPGHCQGRRSWRWVAYPHQDQLRRVGRGDEGTAPGAAHVGSSSVRRCRLLRGSTGAGCPHCCSPARDAVLAFQEADCQGGLGRHHCGTHRQRPRPQDHAAGTSQGVGEPSLQAR
jgi:hypothetical protein